MDKARSLRDAFGTYPTGVTLITLMEQGKALAMTVNSFASVSLDPALILWSVDKRGNRYETFRDAERFAVNILAADQQALANACAAEAELDRTGVQWTAGANGAPLVAGAITHLECERFAVHPAGDHDIIVGRITALDRPREAPALVFHRSGYGKSDIRS